MSTDPLHAVSPPRPPAPQDPDVAPAASATGRVPPSRIGTVWLGICASALLLVVLIVFMLQNTRSTQISFLGWDGDVPLALALLIAAVGAAILTMVVATARITQLRLLARRRR
ncbi:lipopolysaccharide assembly protein LapA domain-containing protein [Cryptosporangium minutisporangium]|uniref:Lipopolysaccharide assembly protein A domain-containing protein n=1 Tax=Cryptosporangium minutisporangium TaxID=113569 RepID=A0ABP6SRE8_9ACTN